ncbi:hypothetical protein [Brachyspira sp.]|uniref:hypothetical protein n=1 Tax=Brachyspira sp. TaxID=1977261 RepID=UPI00261BF5AE|nr:hypothetical protein [Brachyspira sp.]
MRKGIIIFVSAAIMIFASVSLFAQCGNGYGRNGRGYHGNSNHSFHYHNGGNYNGCYYNN